MTVRDLIRLAHAELGAVTPADDVEGGEESLSLVILNLLLDEWNADHRKVYCEVVSPFTLVPATNPHTIGPTAATWTMTQRPVSIEALSIESSDGINSDVTVYQGQVGASWWAERSRSDITSTLPTEAYYAADWPLGKLYFYPIPSSALDVDLTSRVLLAQVLATTTVSLPPGYASALYLTLAERRAASLGVTLSLKTVDLARVARETAFGNNPTPKPRLLADVGAGGGGSAYDWRKGPLG